LPLFTESPRRGLLGNSVAHLECPQRREQKSR
jgi:hypothetical protein